MAAHEIPKKYIKSQIPTKEKKTNIGKKGKKYWKKKVKKKQEIVNTQIFIITQWRHPFPFLSLPAFSLLSSSSLTRIHYRIYLYFSFFGSLVNPYKFFVQIINTHFVLGLKFKPFLIVFYQKGRILELFLQFFFWYTHIDISLKYCKNKIKKAFFSGKQEKGWSWFFKILVKLGVGNWWHLLQFSHRWEDKGRRHWKRSWRRWIWQMLGCCKL